MSLPPTIKGRYEIKEVIGKGGMGVVYRAFDAVVRRDIALKTVLDIADAKSLELFQKEYEVLASISHPNIVEIFDLGALEEKGERIPYFVMPLLNGMTLDKLIRSSSHRLTAERAVAIVTQTCRGLQAAHERGLIHRDLKPSNIFVMEDDSARIIDFGVVHKSDALTTRGWKGTLQYMAPELIEMKPPSVRSDVFSLGVVAYEVLTQRRPFERASQHEILQALLHHIPPAASEINSAVSQSVSQVIHKAMAKQPYHRFSSARELAETLQRAFRGEPLELFDPARIQPRIQRAGKAYEQGDYQFADEILSELQAEGHIDPAITLLRGQLDQAIRQKRIHQLLDSARTRFEEEEYPLALQKVQQALELDPDNATAISLQREIEQRRTEGKIEDWFRLAREHIDNHAYAHAREALQNVLQLKPTESRARQMRAEVDRLEEEYLAIREEKEQLYEAAMEAWKSGEVSSALHRLERALDLDQRAPDSSVPERSATYQTFYKQVRSEYDAMNNSYAEARKHVSDRDFARAMAVCEEYLAKYPGNALFQALKFDVEEERRQELSSYIAEIDRQVDAEPDLGKRVNILKEALDRHPGEAHFERALRIMREKRDLVNSIVAKAQLHEERGEFTEALGQWEILQTIYSQYPGLSFEIERVLKRRDQQTRLEAKARAVAQIDRELHLGDFRRALDLLKRAKGEYPKDAELAELEKLARRGIRRTAEAERLFEQGQELCGQKRFEEGVETLRKAHQLDEANPSIRVALVETLVEQARSIVDKDWSAAAELTRQALALDPSHSQAKSLRTLALDRQREEFVDGCLGQARQLQTAGDLEGALRVVEQGLATHPRNARLGQLHATLGIAILESQRRQARRRDLEELGRLDREAEAVEDAAPAMRMSERLRTIVRKYPDDPEVSLIAKTIESRLSRVLSRPRQAPAKPVERPAAAPPPAGARMPAAAPPSEKPAAPPPPPAEATLVLRGTPLGPKLSAPEGTLPGAPPTGKPAAATPVPAPREAEKAAAKASHPTREPEVRGRAATEEGLRRVRWAWVGAAAVLVFLVAALLVWRSRGPESAAGTVPFVVRTSPEGATIRIDGKAYGTSDLQLEIPAGTHQLQALKEGYEPESVTVRVAASPEGPASVELKLQPLAQVVYLRTDFEIGRVKLDGEAVGDLQEGEFTLDNVAPGPHELEISGRQGGVSIAFEMTPGAVPRVTGPVKANEFRAVALGTLGTRAIVHCSFGPAPATVDGRPVGDVDAGGIVLENLTSGAHELMLGEGEAQRKLIIESGQAPTLTVSLTSDRDVGTLVVVAGEDDVRVLLDGREYRRGTRRGRLRIPNLAVREYSVQVSKAGFEAVPRQHAEIRRGEETRLQFTMVPLPTVAALTIQGAMPGTEVILDGNPLGAVQPDGSFSASNLEPGAHTIELRKEAYRLKQFTRQFRAGQSVQLTAAEVSLETTLGTLRLSVSPPESQVTFIRRGESRARPVNDSTLTLPEGSYIFSARAPNHSSRSAAVQIVASETRTLSLVLAEEKRGGMGDWEDPDGWTRNGNWYVRRGGNFTLFRTTPTAGRFVFTAALRRGRRLQWVLNQKDKKNYLLFQMDKTCFYRSQVRDGDSSGEFKVEHGLGSTGYYTMQIKVSADGIVHEAYDGKKWIVLDSWKGPELNLAEGRFGFLIPRSDEVAVSNFTFYPQ